MQSWIFSIITPVFFFFFLLFINQRNLKKVSQVSNIDNKSELHKMYFKVY